MGGISLAKSIKKVKKELEKNPAMRAALAELGLLEEVETHGWLRLSSAQCGRVGAVFNAVKKKQGQAAGKAGK